LNTSKARRRYWGNLRKSMSTAEFNRKVLMNSMIFSETSKNILDWRGYSEGSVNGIRVLK